MEPGDQPSSTAEQPRTRLEVPPEAFGGVVSELLRDSTHALRNTLSASRNALDLLSRGLAKPEDVAAMRRLAQNAIQRLDHQLTAINELARVCEGTGSTEDVRAVLDEVLRGCEPLALARRVTLARATWERAPARHHAPSLRLALEAVVRNALEASPEGGTVRASVEPGAQGGARLAVHDEGEGIPPERARNVFRLFHTSKEQASGLGLSLARLAVSAHGGALVLETSPGRGTSVTVLLPA